MTSKNITIMEDAYELLKRSKHEDESFSDVLRRVLSIRPKKNLRDYFGILSDREGDAVLRCLEAKRKANIAQKIRRLQI